MIIDISTGADRGTSKSTNLRITFCPCCCAMAVLSRSSCPVEETRLSQGQKSAVLLLTLLMLLAGFVVLSDSLSGCVPKKYFPFVARENRADTGEQSYQFAACCIGPLATGAVSSSPPSPVQLDVEDKYLSSTSILWIDNQTWSSSFNFLLP